jgi:phospholipid/cholesterol/gamma-HCH transport system substrate-binding protein
MNLELSRRAVVGVLVFAVITLGLLLYMLGRLGAVPLPGTKSVQAQALLANADGLPIDADVLVHGVSVGSVSGVTARPGGTLVTLSLGSGAPQLHANASLQVGEKTFLGEPFVDLSPGSGPPLPRGARIRGGSAVEIDDALSWLDAAGRANLRTVLDSLGAGLASPQSGAELSGTLAQLPATTTSLNTLAATLSAQRGALSRTVLAGRTVLDTLASRAQTLRTLTVGAHQTLAALASERAALAGTLQRLPGTLTLTDSTLAALRPLIARATPVAGQLAEAAPALRSALTQLPAVTGSANALLGKAGAIRTDVVPVLDQLRALAHPATSALSILGPVLADMIPMAQFLAPRADTIAAWFANTADLGSHGDAKGDWARFFVMFDPATLLGVQGGAPKSNAYTAPGDAADNQPYSSGGYQRLMPYAPALAGTAH